MAHNWTSGKCAICKRQVKVRTVSLIRPAFLSFCGPCARRVEQIPFEQRIIEHIRGQIPLGYR